MPAPEQRRIIFKHIDEPGYTNDIGCYLRNGGYEVLKEAVARQARRAHRRSQKVRPARSRRRGFPVRREVGSR